MLRWIHAHASPVRTGWWVVTDLGTWLGVVPITVPVSPGAAAERLVLFVLLSVGAWVLNGAAKAFYGRERPALWNSTTQQMWFGFPAATR